MKNLLATAVLMVGAASFVWAQQGQDQQSPAREGQSAAQKDQSKNQAGQNSESGRQQSGQYSTPNQPGAQSDMQQPKTPEQRFLMCSIQGDLFEAKLAEIVAGKCPDNNVKQFAQKLAEDHRNHLQQVKQAAQGTRGFQVSEQMAPWQQQKLQALSQLDPEALQQQFLFGAVAAHHMKILENKFAAAKIQDTQIKTLATRTVPILQQHLQQADRLCQQVLGVQSDDAGIGVSGR